MKKFTFQTKTGLKIFGNYFEFPQKIKKSQEAAFDIIFIHAFPFDSRMYINNLKEENFVQSLNNMSLINGKIRIILPDMPGFGESGLFSSKPIDILPYVEILNEIIKFFQIDKFILGGCSMGGYIVLEFARNKPKGLEGLVLIDTKPYADNPEQKENRLSTIKIINNSLKIHTENERSITMEKLYQKNEKIKSFIDNLFSRITSQTTRTHKPKVTRQILNLMKKQKAMGLIYALYAMAGRNDTSDVLQNLNIKTIIMVGENDIITPIEIAEEMKNMTLNSEIGIISSAGHLSNVENLLEFNRRLLHWLQIKF